jgi:hypothetical protein
MFRFHVFAYLDPATGSTLFQLAIATVLSLLAAVRYRWAQVKALFRGARTSTNLK